MSVNHGAQIPKWSPFEIISVITGATSAIAGILLTPPGSTDEGHARAGYVLELTGAALVLGITTERAVRTYIAERDHVKATEVVRENPTSRSDADVSLWNYMSNEQRTYVCRGFEKDQDDDSIVLRRVPIDSFLIDMRGLKIARSDVLRGDRSRTKGPVSLRYDPDKKVFFLTDGHHRLVQTIDKGRRTIDVEIVGAGYSDYWATPSTKLSFR